MRSGASSVSTWPTVRLKSRATRSSSCATKKVLAEPLPCACPAWLKGQSFSACCHSQSHPAGASRSRAPVHCTSPRIPKWIRSLGFAANTHRRLLRPRSSNLQILNEPEAYLRATQKARRAWHPKFATVALDCKKTQNKNQTQHAIPKAIGSF